MSVDKQHKRSSSVGNAIDSSAIFHLPTDSDSPSKLQPSSHPSSRHGSTEHLEDSSSLPSSRRGSDSEVLDSQHRVICSYEKRQSNEISLTEGDTVDVIDKLISGKKLYIFQHDCIILGL
jgi:hypothetical protein